ncbi:transposable element Tcb2 transposase [Trichonephila clavipes]|nr:transposable element Tcb2 transposase [Trichonephila clavipes]
MARWNHLDDFTRGRMIRKLEEGHTVTSVAAEFRINNSVVSRAWKEFQITDTAAKRGQHQSASAIAQQLCTTTGRQVLRFTVAKRLHKGGLFTHRLGRCLPLKVGHRRHCLQWCREHKNWKTDEWSRVLFTDESVLYQKQFSTRFDLERDRDPVLSQ